MKNYILKISGSGNRFLLADKKNFNLESSPSNWKEHSYKTDYSFEDFVKLSETNILNRKDFIKKLISQENLSLTDGLIVLKCMPDSSLHCDFYNKDGSTAEMCGNASCCVSMYAHWQSFPLKTFSLGETKISCLKAGGVIFNQPDPSILNFNEDYNFYFINTGVPHGVIECSNSLDFSNKTELKKMAEKLRFRNINKHQGMNVSFYKVIQKAQLKAITYERGVEDWTLACGTGALATALVYLHKHSVKNRDTVFIEMPGGRLKVQIKPNLALFSHVKKGF